MVVSEIGAIHISFRGFKRSIPCTVLSWILTILTFGILRLVFHWWPGKYLHPTHRLCTLKEADKVVVTEKFRTYITKRVQEVQTISSDIFGKKLQNIDTFIEDELTKITIEYNWDKFKLVLPTFDGTIGDVPYVRYFLYKKMPYIWYEERQEFIELVGYDSLAANQLHKTIGLSVLEQAERRLLYGPNKVPIKIRSLFTLFVIEALNPFYCFQIVAVALWIYDEYYYYAGIVIVLSFACIIATILQTRQNSKSQLRLKKLALNSALVTVRRKNKNQELIPSEQLVPGDVILISRADITMTCDAVLLSGNCIVNESMLTGEIIPVMKTSLPDRGDIIYNRKEHSRNTIFSGTQILQIRGGKRDDDEIMAVVIRTGDNMLTGLSVARGCRMLDPSDKVIFVSHTKDPEPQLDRDVVLIFVYVRGQSWFEEFHYKDEKPGLFKSHENYALFSVSIFQYITIATVFSRGKPFRKPLWSNLGLVISLVVMTLVSLYLVIWPVAWFTSEDGLQLRPPPEDYLEARFIFLCFALCHFLTAFLVEYGLIHFLIEKQLKKWRFPEGKPKSNKKFDKTEFEVSGLDNWPPIKNQGPDIMQM